MILQKKKVIFENDVTTMKEPDLSLWIYPTTDKVSQNRYVDENRREQEERQKETIKKTADHKFCLQKKRSLAFQKLQDSMYSLLLSPLNITCY